MKIQDKVILITGAFSGIGKATALALDKQGAKVAMAARRKNLLEENAAKMKNPLVIQTDLSETSQAEAMIKKTIDYFGRLDVLINNAAAIIVSEADTTGGQTLERAFRTNPIGPVLATNLAIQQMQKQGYGQIINVGSPSFMIGGPYYIAYVCTKASLSAWTRSIQGEWAGGNVVISYTKILSGTDLRPRIKVYDESGTAVSTSIVIGNGSNHEFDLAALNNGNVAVIYEDWVSALDSMATHFVIHDSMGTEVKSATMVGVRGIFLTMSVSSFSDGKIAAFSFNSFDIFSQDGNTRYRDNVTFTIDEELRDIISVGRSDGNVTIAYLKQTQGYSVSVSGRFVTIDSSGAIVNGPKDFFSCGGPSNISPVALDNGEVLIAYHYININQAAFVIVE